MRSIGIGSRRFATVSALTALVLTSAFVSRGTGAPQTAGFITDAVSAQEQGESVVAQGAQTATYREFVLEEATGRDVPEPGTRSDDAGFVFSSRRSLQPEGVEGITPQSLSGSWTALSSGTTNNLWGLDTLSSTNVWTVGLSTTVLHSTDGGASWVPSSTGIGSGRELDSVDFVDPTYGWIIGPNTIARTEDGGSNWRYWTSSPSAVRLYSGTAVSSSVAWGVGVSYDSTYGWCTMMSRFTYTGSLSVYQLAWCPGNAYIGISMLNPDVGWTVGASGMVRKVTGGTASPPTTIPQTSGTSSSLRAVLAIDANTAYAVGFNGTIIKTTNGGTTWGPQTSGTTQTLWNIKCASATECLVTGSGGTVLGTDDGGTTWTPESSGTSADLSNVAFPALAAGYAVGSGGVILKRVPPCTYSIDPSSVTVGAGGGSGSVTLTATAGCPWTAESNAWITITPASGTGSATLNYSVAANPGGPRTGTVMIAGRPFTVIQSAAACSYSIDWPSILFPPEGGTGTIGVTTGSWCSWTAVSNDEWITVTGGASGTGNGTVSYSVAANSAGARTGTITIAGQTGTINQAAAACSYSIDPTNLSAPAEGATGTVAVTTGSWCNWTAVSNDAWITVTGGSSGTGNGTVGYSVAVNSGGARTGTITIAGQTFTVNQAAAACSYSIDPTGISPPPEGASGTVVVTTGSWCDWTAVSNDAWITVTGGASGTGNGTVSYSVAPNPSGARTGSITIADKTFWVNQAAAACSYSIDPTSISPPAGGATGTVAVTTDSWCNWIAVCNDAWITVTGGASGTGNGTVSYSVAANTGAARTGTCTIAGQIFTVNQAEALVRAAALVLTPLSQGVLKLADTVEVQPSWRNDGTTPTADMTGTGTASNGGTIVDDAASYGVVGIGATASCAGMSDCYSLTASGPRPANHWDVKLNETLSEPASHEWLLHVGDSFTDVPRTSSYFRFIETLYHKLVTGGCTATTYCPGNSTTRAQMSIFALVGKEGAAYSPVACGTTPMFADVAVTSPYCKWVEELARRGVVGGCGGGNYCPNNAVTRGQMAIFMLKTLDPALDPPACTTPMFGDVPAASPYCKWIEELTRRGVVSGCGGGNYCPSNPVTRAQMGVFISATFGLTLYGP
jgi:photosystem II stability/assembly factor-like uncharacterized protein